MIHGPSLPCPSSTSGGSPDPDVVEGPGSSFQGSPGGLGRDLWIVDEQKEFVVVMGNKMV